MAKFLNSTLRLPETIIMSSHYNLYISLEGRGHNTHIKPKFDFFSVWLPKTKPINKLCSDWLKIGLMFFL